MKVLVLFTGGKDSCHATWVVQHHGWEIAKLVSVRPATHFSKLFHRPGVEWNRLQAEAMGLAYEEVQTTTEDPERELRTLEEAIRIASRDTGSDGLVTGAIASDYQKSRFDRMADRVGLKSFSPLWHKDPGLLLSEIVSFGFEPLMVSVSAMGLGQDWLGRRLDSVSGENLLRVSRKYGVHLSGEGGEFETYVVDGPNFSKRVEIEKSEKVWQGQSGFLRILSANLGQKRSSVF